MLATPAKAPFTMLVPHILTVLFEEYKRDLISGNGNSTNIRQMNTKIWKRHLVRIKMPYHNFDLIRLNDLDNNRNVNLAQERMFI